jgi:hypothetical protein
MSTPYSNKPQCEKVYGPLEEKTFNNVIKHFFRENFPKVSGNLVLDLICKELHEIIEKYYPPISRLKMGQMLWFAVSQDETPSKHSSMSQVEMVPVILTLVHEDDIHQSSQGVPRHVIAQSVLPRIYTEAKEQGGVLTETDISLIRNLSLRTVSKQTLAFEKSNDCVLPRRGTIHDLGPSVSHKKIICKKFYIDHSEISDIAWQTFHSPKSISRYINDFKRVMVCLGKGLSIEETAFASFLSKKVVNQYSDLSNEIFNEQKAKHSDFCADVFDGEIPF